MDTAASCLVTFSRATKIDGWGRDKNNFRPMPFIYQSPCRNRPFHFWQLQIPFSPHLLQTRATFLHPQSTPIINPNRYPTHSSPFHSLPPLAERLSTVGMREHVQERAQGEGGLQDETKGGWDNEAGQLVNDGRGLFSLDSKKAERMSEPWTMG